MKKAEDTPNENIRTKPEPTKNGRPFDYVVKDKVDKGEYRLECVPAEILGTSRPIEIYRAKRAKGNIIKQWKPNTNDDSYCPASFELCFKLHVYHHHF